MLTRKQRAQFEKISTLLGEDLVIKDGVLFAQNTVRIDGSYKGEIQSKGALIIGGNGQVEGNIQCENITISGKVMGNINSSNQIHIKDTGSVMGDLECMTIIIEEGGIFMGRCNITKAIINDVPLEDDDENTAESA